MAKSQAQAIESERKRWERSDERNVCLLVFLLVGFGVCVCLFFCVLLVLLFFCVCFLLFFFVWYTSGWMVVGGAAVGVCFLGGMLVFSCFCFSSFLGEDSFGIFQAA